MFSPNEIRRLEVDAELAELDAKQAGVRAKQAKLQAERDLLVPSMPDVMPEIQHTRKSASSLALTLVLISGAAAAGWAFNREMGSGTKATQAHVFQPE